MGNSAIVIFVTPWAQNIQFLLENFTLLQQTRLELSLNDTDFALGTIYIYLNVEKIYKDSIKTSTLIHKHIS